MAAKEKLSGIKLMLLDPSIPFEHRRQTLRQLCMHDSEDAMAVVASILDAAASSNGEELYKKKVEEFDGLIKEMKDGPMRYATFIRMLERDGPTPRAQVKLEDGTTAFSLVPDLEMAAALKRGDHVLLDGQGRAILYHDAVGRWPSAGDGTGEEARLERRIGADCVEVSLRSDERLVIHASQALADKLDRGEAEAGDYVLISSRQGMAWDVLPRADKLANYHFLDRKRVPDVVAERDIGAPPAYLDNVAETVYLEMVNPELRRLFRQRRCQMQLLSGRSGTGKTLSVYALWRRLYEVMSEVTGVPIDELPPRVMRLRTAQVLRSR